METFLVFIVSCLYLQQIAMEKILSSCSEMFLTLGFKSVTMDYIAQNLAISKKTLYTHFPNKQALVRNCVFHFFDYMTGEISRISEEASNPISELYEIKLFMMRKIKNEKISPQYQLKKFYPEIFKELQEKQMTFMVKRMSASLKKGVSIGLFRSNLNIPFIARLYFNGMMGIKDQNLFPANIFQHSQLMTDYLEYHVRAICTEAGIALFNTFDNHAHD